mgnify:CR=1 FL=1
MKLPQKSLQYYWRTIISKGIAFVSFQLRNTSFLKRREENRVKKYKEIFDEQYKNGIVDSSNSAGSLYYTYSYFLKAQDLKRFFTFDDSGIAMCRIDTFPKEHNPLIACYFGLVCYNEFMENNEKNSLQNFWQHLYHIQSISTISKECLFTYYQKDNIRHQIKAPWYSGLTQALVTSLFIRGYLLSKEEDYKKKAKKSLNALFLPVQQGGVFTTREEGLNWIEERPTKHLDGTLNGYIFSLIAVYEYYLFIEKTAELEEHIQSLSKTLFYVFGKYIFGKYTRYDIHQYTFHNIEYQGLYAYFWLHLYHLSGKSAFLDLAKQFHQNTDWKDFYYFFGLKYNGQEIFKNRLKKIQK